MRDDPRHPHLPDGEHPVDRPYRMNVGFFLALAIAVVALLVIVYLAL